MPLTLKNRRAIDLYLSNDSKFSGNGAASWMRVYGTNSLKTAQVNWSRMLSNASAQAYLEKRTWEIEAKRGEQIAYERAQYMRDLKRMLDHAMEWIKNGKMRSASDARRIAHDLHAADTGNVFPGQRKTPMQVNIQINTGHPEVDDLTSEVAEAVPRIGRPYPRKTLIIGKGRV